MRNVYAKTNKSLSLIIVFILFICSESAKAQSGFTASAVTGCPPLSIQFNANQPAQNYLWDFGDGAGSVLASPSHVYQQPGSYTVKLKVTGINGAEDSTIRINYITILNKPVADFSILNNVVCQNSATASFSNLSQNASLYTWDFGDGVTSSLANPSHIYTTAGIYNVQLIAKNSSGCSDYKSITSAVQVVAQPVVSFVAADTILCYPQNSTVFTNLTPAVMNLQWNFGDGTFSSQVSPTHAFSNPGSYDITLIAQNTSGCSDTLKKSSYVKVMPATTSSISSSVTTGCVPLAVSFSTGQALSYLWDFGNGNTSTSSAPSTIYNNSGTYNVTVTLQKANGCTEVINAPALIDIPVQPTAYYTVSNTNGCAPLTSNFTNLSQNAVSYVWTFGDGHNSTQVNPSNTYSVNGNYNVLLKAYNSAGCMSSYTSNTQIHSSKPHSDFTTNGRVNCAPFTVNFTNTSNVGAVSYIWDFGDGTTSVQSNPSHVYNSAGNFTVKLISFNSNGCSDTLVRVDYITVINPNVNYAVPDTLRGCAPFTVSMNDSTYGANSWLWQFGDGTQSIIRNPEHTYTQAGIYSVQLNLGLSGGCTQFYPVFKKIIVDDINPGFTYSYDCTTHAVTFVDTTSGLAANAWSFSDGTFSSSINPVHTYPGYGYYNVSLNVTSMQGCTKTVSFVNLINVYPCSTGTVSTGTVTANGGEGSVYNENPNTPPAINNQIRGCAPLTANFNYPLSTGTPLLWIFGDNTSSALPNPSHVYTQGGTYTVKLAYLKTNGTVDTLRYNNLISINRPEADFTATLSSNCVQYVVNTTNYSAFANKFAWNFGDNTGSAAFSPTHTYNTIQSNYSVSLLASDTISGCSAAHTKTLFVSNNNVIWANKYEGCAGVNLYFYFSSASYVSYSWDFGDGTTSSVQNPVHAYTAAGSYNVHLTVVDNYGCSKTFELPQPIIVYDPQADFTYTRSGSCSGYQISFNNLGTPANPGANGFYYWTFGDGASATQNTPTLIHNYTSPGTYSVTMKIVTNGGCINSIAKPVVVNRLEADFSVQQNRKCFPMDVTLTNLTTNAVNYSWNFGNGQTSALVNPTVTFNELPSDSIRLIVSDARGCTDTVSKFNFEFFTNNIVLPNDSVCANSIIHFTTNSDSVVNNWNFGDGGISQLANPAHSYLSNGTFPVSLVSTDTHGCVDTSQASVFVSSSVSAFLTPDTSGCAPKLVQFINQSIDGNAYIWDFGDGSGSTSANPSHIYNTPGFYTVKLISFNSLGCADTLIIPHYIHIIGPVVSFTLQDDTVCFSNPVQLQIASSNVSDWLWDFGDGASSTASNPSHTYAQPGHYIISLIAHDVNACSAYFIDSTLFIASNPHAVFTSDLYNACSPANVNFFNTSVGADTYNWNFGNGVTSVIPQVPTQVFTNPGDYTVQLVALNETGCSDTAHVTVHVAQSPVADFTVNNQNICNGSLVQFTNSSHDTIQAAYQWMIGQTVFSTQSAPQLALSTAGVQTISLIVTNNNNCSDTLIQPGLITVADSLAPQASSIKLVSVVSDSSVSVLWEETSCSDFHSYIIYRLNNLTGQYAAIDTVFNKQIVAYTDSHVNTLTHSYWYKVQTVDICGNRMLLEQLIPARTIEVKASLLPDNTIAVNWNAYSGCTVSGYKIERSEAGSTQFVEIATVLPSQLGYIDSSAYCPVNFTYRIKGLDVCGASLFSLSDTTTARPRNLFKNQKVDIIRSTVVNNSYILTEWKQPEVMANGIAAYKLYRKTGTDGYTLIAELPAAQTSYLDYDVNVNGASYEYKIVPVNTCNIAAGAGQKGISVLLDMHQGEKQTILRWSAYNKWDTGVDHYIIERLNENGVWEEVKTVDGNTTEEILEEE